MHFQHKSYYFSLNYVDFIKNFDVALMNEIKTKTDPDYENLEELLDIDFEINFLNEAEEYVIRSDDVLVRYLRHCEKRNKPIPNGLVSILLGNNYKSFFISSKLKKLGFDVDIKKTIANLKGISSKKTDKNLLFGKSLNLLERYLIADKVLDIDKKIRILNISDREKYDLLSFILGCNPTNARHIMNGKYNATIRNDIMTSYIESLKIKN